MTQQILFQREVRIDAPLTHVWQLVATEEGLRQWWGNPIHLEPKEGGRCEEWRTDKQGTTLWQGVVTLYAPPHQLVMTLRNQTPEPETRKIETLKIETLEPETPELTTIVITLEAKGEQTRVHVVQRAFGSAAAVGNEGDRTVLPQPTMPRGIPLAQLDQPAPGSLPMTAPAIQQGHVDPAHYLLSRQEASALIMTWEQRLGALITSAQREARD